MRRAHPGHRRRLGAADTLDFARLAVTPVRRLAHERFTGPGAGLLLTGNALHSDVPPDSAGSGIFGWLLCMLGQDVGFPVPAGGAGELAQSLRRRAESKGAQVLTGTAVTAVSTTGRALPLLGTSLTADASGGVARVVVEQRFHNPHAEPLAVTYSLPLPSDGAVSGFSFRVGGRRVVVRFEAGYPCAQVFAPPGKDLICFEPMTAPANALRTGTFAVAAPGRPYAAAFTIAVDAE